jgi:hypothetical protein
MKYVGKTILIAIILGTIIYFIAFAVQESYKWSVSKNGRRYYLKNTCIKSHEEPTTRTQIVGKTLMTFPDTKEICDKYKVDTIWENLTKQQEQ